MFEKHNKKNNNIVEELQLLAAQHKYELDGLDLSFINLEKVDIENAKFSSSILTQANFKNSRLNFSQFHGVCLYKANLSNTELAGADLNTANLYKANLENSMLISTMFFNAKLIEANLKGAKILTKQQEHLYQTNFMQATLAGADLSNTDIATLHPLNFHKAKYNSKEILLGKLLSHKELFRLCKHKRAYEAIKCQDIMKNNKVRPTIFPEGFDVKKYTDECHLIDMSDPQQEKRCQTK